eukprot:scaffold2450_cov401-Prasinococcus_capsulatus_cf.AAC.4
MMHDRVGAGGRGCLFGWLVGAPSAMDAALIVVEPGTFGRSLHTHCRPDPPRSGPTRGSSSVTYVYAP